MGVYLPVWRQMELHLDDFVNLRVCVKLNVFDEPEGVCISRNVQFALPV